MFDIRKSNNIINTVSTRPVNQKITSTGQDYKVTHKTDLLNV